MDKLDQNPMMANAGGEPQFSIIVPCFEEAETLDEFHARLSAALDKLPHSFEIVYVNDGSRDQTLANLHALFERDARIGRVIDLATNCGQSLALSAGIQHAAGHDFILMDCDLQIEPEDIGRLIDAFGPELDMVSGLREKRQDALARRALSMVGNKILSGLSGIAVSDLGSGLKIIRGSLLRAFQITPWQPLDPGIVIASLREVVEVPVAHHPRRHGRSRWTLRRVLTLYHNVITNLLPVLYPVAVGTLTLLMCLLFALFGVAAVFPAVVPWTANPVVPTLLISAHMILTLILLFMVGAFTLRGRFATTGPAYVVRGMWCRPATDGEGAAGHGGLAPAQAADSEKVLST